MTAQPSEMESRIEKMKKSLAPGWKLNRRTRKLSSGPTTYLILSSWSEVRYSKFQDVMKAHFPKAFVTSFGSVGGARGGTWRIDNFPEASNEGVDIHY